MKEASPNPILAVFVGKASRGTAFCFAFFIMVFSELQFLCALDVYVSIDVGRPVLLEEIGDR